jgi:hypothetical protein
MYWIPLLAIVLLGLLAVAWNPIFALVIFALFIVGFFAFVGMRRSAEGQAEAPEQAGAPERAEPESGGIWGERRPQ